MSKLSDTDWFRPLSEIDTRIIRNRKLRPLHPEDILERLAEKSAHLEPVSRRRQRWKIVLFRPDNTKHYAQRVGDYAKVCKDREDLMESGDYEKAWLISEGYE